MATDAPSMQSRKRAPSKRAGKHGPPPIELDLGELQKLAGMFCTYSDAAGWFSVSLATFERRMTRPEYRDAWERGCGKGRASLRVKQFKLADHNAAMAIFLGKNYLHQRDAQQLEHSVDIDEARRLIEQATQRVLRHVPEEKREEALRDMAGGLDGDGVTESPGTGSLH